ncbi:hypothetical protein [Gulosibacter sp. 10]|uniref:hypothetical protein n=1 Tax=Gulosibacter sp. 10 TaxID=1255570 RepID=UPI000B3646B6|nr:hypothetical protein [Gulosibacter sp. 10]
MPARRRTTAAIAASSMLLALTACSQQPQPSAPESAPEPVECGSATAPVFTGEAAAWVTTADAGEFTVVTGAPAIETAADGAVFTVDVSLATPTIWSEVISAGRHLVLADAEGRVCEPADVSGANQQFMTGVNSDEFMDIDLAFEVPEGSDPAD